MMDHNVNDVLNEGAIYESFIHEESKNPSAFSTQMISGIEGVGVLFDVKPFPSMKDITITEPTTPYAGTTLETNANNVTLYMFYII